MNDFNFQFQITNEMISNFKVEVQINLSCVTLKWPLLGLKSE